MLTAVDITNASGNTLQLPLQTSPDGYIVREIDGLDPVAASLVTSTMAQVDGAQPQNARRDARNITMKLGLRPVYAISSVRSLRAGLYDYFLPKANISLGFYDDDVLFAVTTGQVETCESSIFSADPEVDISVLCYDPDFYSPSQVTFSSHTQSDNVTTVPVNYQGSSDTGFIFNMILSRNMNNLVISCLNPDGTQRALTLTGSFVPGDVVTINTIPGQKDINLFRSGISSSVLYYMSGTSSWPYLQKGLNQFGAYSPGLGISYTLVYTPKLGGL